MVTKASSAIVLCLLCLLAVPQISRADGPPPPPKHEEGYHRPGPGGPGMMGGPDMKGMPNMEALTSLEPTQRAAYLDLVTESQKKCLDIRKQLLLTKVEMMEVMKAETFDKAKAEELTKKLVGLVSEMVQNKLDLAISLRSMGLSCDTIASLGHLQMEMRHGMPGMPPKGPKPMPKDKDKK